MRVSSGVECRSPRREKLTFPFNEPVIAPIAEIPVLQRHVRRCYVSRVTLPNRGIRYPWRYPGGQMKLTALNVETWKPSTVRQEILDRDGLYFIVQPSGVRSWALRYRRKGDGKAIKHPIGSYPAVTLKDARSAAIALRAEIER